MSVSEKEKSDGRRASLPPEERLVVAADFKPTPEQLTDDPEVFKDGVREWVEKKVLGLADALKDTGVYLKVNAPLRALGYGCIEEIHDKGLKVFADLKLFDIGETLSADAELLKEARPEILTVACHSGPRALRILRETFIGCSVAGVTVLTSLNEDDSQAMFACSIEEAVIRLAQFADDAGLGELVCSAKEVGALRAKFGSTMLLTTPAIRPIWAIVPGDDQNPDRIMTPGKAIKAGADRIVVGRPILNAKNPRDAVMRTLGEIESALG